MAPAYFRVKLETAGASLETRRSAMVRLRTALNLAVKRQHLARNVAALVERPRVPRPKHQPPRITDLRRLLEVIGGDRMQALVYVALGASLRRGEVLGLHWEDVELDGRQLHVRRRVNRVGKGVGLGLLHERFQRVTRYLSNDQLHGRDRWPGCCDRSRASIRHRR